MPLFLSFAVALFVTIALMPALIRYAGPLQLLDAPSPRKVHVNPIPRCGGVALAIGTIAALSLWLDWDRQLLAFLGGLSVITIVGVWDDRHTLNYAPKLAAQFIAAGLLVAGGVQFTHLPFLGLDPVAPWVGALATMLYVVTVTNAINLSDGLDGLAAGSVLISIAVIAMLALPAESPQQLLLLAALTGGIFGFLRFNTFPARVFLGDGGSYFLGFSIAVATIRLMSDGNLAISPALALFIPGLPLLDMIWVTSRRLLRGQSPFAADAGHLHHKLLQFGLTHHDAVGVYYVMHALMGIGAYVMAYETDAMILALYGLAMLLLYGTYWVISRRQLTLNRALLQLILSIGPGKRAMTDYGKYFDILLSVAFAAFIALAFLNIESISIGIASLPPILAVLLAASLMRNQLSFDAVLRFCIHSSTIAIIYLSSGHDTISWYPIPAQYVHLAAMLALLALSMRADLHNQFRLTSFDTLLIVVALVTPWVAQRYIGDFPAAEFVVKTAVLLYIAEYLFRGESALPRTVARRVTSASLGLCLIAITVKALTA